MEQAADAGPHVRACPTLSLLSTKKESEREGIGCPLSAGGNWRRKAGGRGRSKECRGLLADAPQLAVCLAAGAKRREEIEEEIEEEIKRRDKGRGEKKKKREGEAIKKRHGTEKKRVFSFC
jgi:hypothetical protein